jgi:hypothetical protein
MLFVPETVARVERKAVIQSFYGDRKDFDEELGPLPES